MPHQDSEHGQDGQQFVVGLLHKTATNAWLPGAFVGTSTVYLLYSQQLGTLSPMHVSAAVAASGWQPLYLFAPVTIFAALFLEASNAATLALLEGYWGGNRLTAFLRRALVRNQFSHWRRYRERNYRLQSEAFDSASAKMLEDGISPVDVEFLRCVTLGLPSKGEYEDDHYDELLRHMDWRHYLGLGEGIALDAASRRSWDFPLPSRMQPTLLGNVLAAMDSDHQAEAIEIDSEKWRRSLPQYSNLRDRLDLLCGVMVSSTILAVVSLPLLTAQTSPWSQVLVPAFLIGVSWLAYRSMIATSRQMRSVLRWQLGRMQA